MDRRDFLKDSLILGGASVLTACAGGIMNRKEAGKTGSMTYRKNRKGEDVSILGYGCMRWPKASDTGNEENLGGYDQQMINALVDKAISSGVTYFDTAPVYCDGLSEKLTGNALKRHDRSRFTIATKLSNFSPATHSREESMKIYKASFENLQVEYIDYYLLHGIGMGGMESFNSRFIDNGMLDFLLEEREKGHIRNLGFSYHGDVEVFDYLLSQNDRYHWDFVQIQMNYMDWEHAKQINKRNTNASYLYEELHKREIPVVIMEPLLGGRLAKVPQGVVTRMQEREPQLSAASWAFRFCGTMPGVMTALSGMTYMEHLEDNLKTFCPLVPLSDSDLEFLESMTLQMLNYPTVPCNDCGYCMPCPYSLNIPGIFQHYNKCVNEGDMATSKMDPDYRKARRRYLSSYDKNIPQMRQADKCIGCNQCIEKCPQGINIPRELRKIDIYVEKLKQETL